MCFDTTVTVLSVPMRTNALGSSAAFATTSPPARPGPAACANSFGESTTPSVNPAPAFRKSRRRRAKRRLNIAVICVSLRERRRGVLDGGPDADVGRAAADVAGHRRIDIRVGGFLLNAQQGRSGHDLPRLAVAALHDVELVPSFLHRFGDAVGFGRGQALDG